MIVERPHRFARAAACAVAVAVALAVIPVRSCRCRTPAVAPRAVLAPVAPSTAMPLRVAAVPPPVVLPAAAPPPSQVAATPGASAAIPSLTVPCVDDTTELLADRGSPVLCWGDHCLVYRDGAVEAASRPGAAATPGPVVGAEQVCTGTRCDRLGPRLRAAIADLEPGERSATLDHAAIVIGGASRHAQVWNRAIDRPIRLGTSGSDGGPDRVEILGNRLILVEACPEFCSATGTIIDARGIRYGKSFAIAPGWISGNMDRLALGDDRFFVFGGFGELTLIEHG